MSDLQIMLIIMGAIIIAGVIAYNFVQERKLRNKITRDFTVPQKDVLTEDFYIDANAYIEKEPPESADKFKSDKNNNVEQTLKPESVSKQSFSEPKPDDAPEDRIMNDEDQRQYSGLKAESNYSDEHCNKDSSLIADQVDYKAPQAPAAAVTSPIENLKGFSHKTLAKPFDTEAQSSQMPHSLHTQIDLTAMLFANQPISTDTLNNLANELADINQIMAIYALDDEDKWQPVTLETPNKLFNQVSFSVQLADRSGPIAKHTLNKFQFAVENIGSELNAHVEWQGTGDAMQRAQALDQFCIEVDQSISVHLIQIDSAIHGTKFKGIAEANGLSLNNDGKFYFYGNMSDAPLFSIIDTSNQAFTLENLRQNVFKSITFQLEIPKVTNSEQVFNQMIMLAQKMANSLSASLVDDNQKPLGDLQVEKIRQQLKIIHAKMVARNIMPGSPSAMRLFN